MHKKHLAMLAVWYVNHWITLYEYRDLISKIYNHAQRTRARGDWIRQRLEAVGNSKPCGNT